MSYMTAVQAGISVERYPSGGGQSLPDVASLRGAPRTHSLSPSGSPGVLAPVSEHQARRPLLVRCPNHDLRLKPSLAVRSRIAYPPYGVNTIPGDCESTPHCMPCNRWLAACRRHSVHKAGVSAPDGQASSLFPARNAASQLAARRGHSWAAGASAPTWARRAASAASPRRRAAAASARSSAGAPAGST